MGLISSIQKNSSQVLETYKTPSGKFTHVLKTQIPGRETRKQIVHCDKFDVPQKIIDTVNGKKEVYTRDKDGGTILQIGEKIMKLSHIAFNNICDKFLK